MFQLVVNDGIANNENREDTRNNQNDDQVIITVLNSNDPPVCRVAQPEPSVVWPPNHKLIPVRILGLTDPENDRVAINILSVTQDEPVNELGDGDASPDAVLQVDGVF